MSIVNSETLNTLNSYSKNKYKYGFVTEIDDEKPKLNNSRYKRKIEEKCN